MKNIDYSDINNIDECNLLQDILNPCKCTKNTNSYYYTILHVCMNTCRGRRKEEKKRILLNSGCSSTILTRTRTSKQLKTKDYVKQRKTQAGNIIIDQKVNIYIILPEFSVKNRDVELSCG